MKNEQPALDFGDAPKIKRKPKTSVRNLPMPEYVKTYEATDDDLPLIFWNDPSFEEEW